MNKFSEESTPNTGRGLLGPALRSFEAERPSLLGQGGRLARGSSGVMTFAPTLGLLGKILSSTTTFGLGILTAGSILAYTAEAACVGNQFFQATACQNTESTTQTWIVSSSESWRSKVYFNSGTNTFFSVNNQGSGNTNHALVIGRSGTAQNVTFTDRNALSTTIAFQASGHGVWLRAGGNSGHTTTVTINRGILSRANAGVFVDGTGGHVVANFNNVSGSSYGIKVSHKGANTANQNVTVSARGAVTSSAGRGVFAEKSTSGNMTVHLSTVSAGGVTWSINNSTESYGNYGVHVLRTGGSGNTEVRATGTISGVRAGFRGVFNNAGGGTNTISLGEVTHAGDQGNSRSRGGVKIHTKNALTFTATGTITGRSTRDSSGYNGFYLRRTDQSSGGTVKVTVSAVSAPGDGIHILDPEENTSVTTNIEITATNHVQGTSRETSDGIFIKKFGKGDVTISAKQVTGGRDGIQAHKYDEGSLSITVSGDVVGHCGERIQNNTLTCRGFDDAGIWAYTDDDSTDLNIDVTSAGSSKGAYGIYAYHEGSGKLTITAAGEIEGDGNDGIRVYNYGANNVDNEPGVKITAKDVDTAHDGINVKNESRGDGGVSITISESGSVTADLDGIYVQNVESGAVLISLLANANVHGEETAIGVVQEGRGNITINASAGSTINSFSATTVNNSTVINGNQGVYVYNAQRGGTISTNISSNIKAAGDGIFVINWANTTTTISTRGTISGAEVSAHGIYVNNIGSGNVSITVSGDVAGGGRRNAQTFPSGTRTNQNASFYRGDRHRYHICNNPSSGTVCIRYRSPTTLTVPAVTIPARTGYALSLNATTSGTKKSGTGTVTVTINSGTISAYNRVPLLPNKADGPGGAIKNGDGNSSITFSGANTGLSGKVSLGKGQDVLVFSGTTISAATELDGGQEAANSTDVDQLTFRNGAKTTGTFLSLDPANIKNWERINLSANTNWRILGTKTLTAANVSVSGTISLSEATAASRLPDDRLTISGNLLGGGTIVLDVNLATGASDTITVTGNVTGATTITINDVTPSNNTTRVTDDITLVTVNGTVSSGAFTTTTAPNSFSLSYRSSTKTFVLMAGPAREPLCKTAEGGAVGTFVCSGNIEFPETMNATGAVNIVATLNSASTTVASNKAGVIFTLRGQNGISFTQSSGGGSLLATGSATGVIDAATTGNGNIDISVEGDVYLAGSGTAIKATSTGPGSITISAKEVSTDHSQAAAVHISGAGSSVMLDGKGAIVGAVQVKNTHSTGTVTVSAALAVTNNSGTAIYAYGKGNTVTVKTSQSTTGNATGNNAVGGIKVVNKSSGSGAILISAGSKVEALGGTGIHAENDGTGALTITAFAVSASNGTPINVIGRNSGNITLNISGSVTGQNSTTAGEGIKVVDSGSGNIEINTASVTGGKHGIFIEKNNSGSVVLTISGTVSGRGTSNREYGISVKPNASAGDITLNLSNHKVTGGYAINIYGKPSAKVTITSSGEIEGKGGGIYFYSDQEATLDFDLHTVTASAVRGISVQGYSGVSASIDVASGGKIEAKTYGIVVNSDGTGPIEVDASGAITAEEGVGIWIDHAGDGAVTLSTVSVTGGKQGILVQKTGTGNVTFTSTGTIESGGNSHGVETTVTGAGNVSLTVSTVDGDTTGVFAKNVGAGTVTIVGNGAITASGTGTKDSGIYAYTNASGDAISITVNSAGSINGKFGIYTESKSDDNITISTSGAVTGTSEDGISAKLTSGRLKIDISGNVTGSSGKTAIDTQTSSAGNTVLTIHNGTITAAGAAGKAITNSDGSSTIVVHSAASVTADIALGAGLDKLTFSGGSNFSRTITIDGGEDTGTDTADDVLEINAISSLLDVSKLTNWEIISFGSGTNARFDGTVTLSVEELKLLSGATLSMKDDAPGDTVTVSGKLTGGGTVEIDVNLSTGAKDSLVVQGNITGTSKIKINNTTPQNASTIQTAIHLLTYTGTSSSNAFSLDGSLSARGYTFSIVHDSTNKRYTLSGSRANLLCVENTNTAGSFACAGTITVPEAMVKTGTTNIVTTLANNATVNVSTFVALYMAGGNGVSFTQAANGGTINASGDASRAIWAKTSGNGNIDITLTGTATLAGAGTVVEAESTGTGNISVSTQGVTATNSAARGIKVNGKGVITVTTNGAVTGGIEVLTDRKGGLITVNANSTIASNNNDGIFVRRSGGDSGTGSVTINTSSASVAGSRNGIRIVDDGNRGSGTLTVNASGAVTATNQSGIFIETNGYDGTVVGASVTVTGAVSAKKSGIFIDLASKGNVSITAHGTVTSTESYGIYATTDGKSITLSTSAAINGTVGVRLTAADFSADAITMSSTGAITGSEEHGVYFKGNNSNSARKPVSTLTVANVTGKKHGILGSNLRTMDLKANGAIQGTDDDGININGKGTTVKVTASSTVSGGKSGIRLFNDSGGDGTVLLDASGAVTGTNGDGIHLVNKRTGSTTVTAASTVSGGTSGITARGEGTGSSSPVTVLANGAVTATSGVGIDAYGKGDSVSVTTSTTVNGSASSQTAVGGIKAVNKSSAAGTVSVSVGGKITTNGGTGIHAENEGTGGLTISAGVIDSSGAGVIASNSNSGVLTLNLTGTITVHASGAGDGVKATSDSEDDLTVNTVSVTGRADGIDLTKEGGGSINLTISGNIVGHGSENNEAGISAVNDSDSDDITLTLSNHSITGGNHGLFVNNDGEGKIEVTATGTITGSGKHGVYVSHDGGAVELNLHTVSGKKNGLQLKHYGSGTATITLASGGSVAGDEGGVHIKGKSAGDISLNIPVSISGGRDAGLYVYHSGDATVTLSVAAVSGTNDGIDLRKFGSGNVTLTATGKIESRNTSADHGIDALSSGAGNISITVGAVTGDDEGIRVRKFEGGTIAITATGAIIAGGYSSSDAGVKAYTDENGGAVIISIGSSGSVSGRYGIVAESKSTGDITINTSGSITGTSEDGIVGEVNTGNLSITVSANVTGSSSKVAIDTKSEATGTTTIVINSGIITASGGTSIQNNGGASDVTINSGATINEKISLGAGVDKLTFVGKAPGTSVELDGGSDSGTDSSVDILTFSGFTGSVSASNLKNWETVQVVAGTTIALAGSQTLTSDTLSLSGGIVSLSNNQIGDSVAVSGNIVGTGSLGIDVNLSTGQTDVFTVSGNLTGTHKLIVNDITQGNQTSRATSIKVVEVSGTTSSPSLTLQNRFKSGGFAYSLEYNAGQKAFFLIGERSTLNCIESTASPGNFTCRGNFSLTENILGEGSGNLVVALDASAVVNVGASVALSMEGAGSISFTQGAGGGWINATGSAVGVIHARTSGTGAIDITLTGTANLIASGTAILVDSTGTGAINVTTTRVTANNNSATAINLKGSGSSITLNTQSGVSGGKAAIIVKNVSSTGTVTVSATGDVASASGTAIYAYGKGASVTVSTGGQASGNAMGIKAVNKSTGAGSLTVTANNSVTGSSDTGIYASNSGQGGLGITAGVVAGGKAGIDARNYTSGNLTINVTGTVTVPDTAGDDGINAYNKGAGDVTVSAVGVTGDASGVDIRNYGGGDITASFNGTILATGSGTGDAGVVLINDAQGGDVTATIIAGTSVTGQHGIRGEHHSSGAFLVNASGSITGRTEDGINISAGTAGSITLNVGEVNAAKRAVFLNNTGAGSVAITATGTVKTNATVTARTAISVVNSGTTTLTLSAVQATGTGVYVNSTGQGSASLTLNGAVASTGDNAVHGVYAKAGTRAGNISINVPTGGGVTGRSTAIKAVSAGSGSVAIVTSGNLAATHRGVHATAAERGNISLNIANDITLSDSGAIAIETSSRSGATTIVIGAGTIGGKTSIKNNDGDSTVTVNKGVVLSGNIELGGGVDKLTFNESFNSSITIDGGTDTGIDRSKDIVAFDSGKASIDIDKLTNWEIIQVGSNGIVAFEGIKTLLIDQLMLAGTLSLKNESAEDEFTLSGNLVPHGTENVGVLEVDVNFSSGESDTITISGDVTGTHNVTLVDVTPSDQTNRHLTRINVITVSGTSTESSFALTGTRFASGGYLYKLNFDDQSRSYYLTGERGTLRCGSSTEGVFACSGTLTFPENIRTIGSTAVRATLATGATVNVTAGVGIQMTSERSISFTQAAGGQPLTASGAAYGVVHASNTGSGDVSVTLTGTANLAGTGTAVTARSTGTGNVSVTTAGVVANHGSATAIRANGRGEQVTVNATAVSAGRNGIIATNRSNGGATSVVTTGAVTSSGTAIYAFSLSGNVNINAAAVSGGISAVVAKNDGGTGNVSVATGGAVTASGGAIQVYNYGTGTLNVRATSSVTGQGSDGIGVIAGADTTSITVSAASTTGRRNAIRVENKGTATVTVNVSGNTVGNRGSAIHVENESSSEINIVASSQITGGNQGTGVDTRTNGGATRITLNAGASVSGASGIAIRNDEGASEITVSAGASISGTVLLGGGVDSLTFADATFGTSILNGGSDTGADVSVDVLTINGGSFALSEENFVNWESIVFGSQTNISVNGVTAIGADNLTVQGTLSMQDDATDDTFTIDGNLIGGGTIKIDADFFSGSYDELIVTGNVTGRTTIDISDISASAGGRDQEAMNIITVTGSSTTVSFSLVNGGFTSGAYQYELEFLPSTRTYALSKKQSVGSVMLVAAPIALLDGFAKLPSLHERRTIDSTQSNWTRVIGNTNSYGKALPGQAEYESQTNGLQAGFDFAKQTTPTGTWVYGVTAQFNSLNTDIKVATTEGELIAEGYGIGATATWAGVNGGYLDIQAQYNQMTIDFKVAGSDTAFIDGQDSTALAISMELGKQHKIGETLTFLTNGQVSWGLADIGDVKSSSGQPIVFGDDANITARFGMRLEYDEEPYNLHVLANLYYDTLESWEATFANATYKDSKDPVSLELGIGGSMKLSPNSNLFMQGGFRKTTDDEFEQRDSAHFTTGVRWSW